MKSILKDIKLALITGGWTGEREESIGISRNVEKILKENGVTPKFIILDKTADLLPQLEDLNVDFALVMMSEEVPIQPILDTLGIPYNGSSNMVTALSLNKDFIKIILDKYGVTVPKDVIYEKGKKLPKINFSLPYVVKPMRCGSSCGVSLVKTVDQLNKACELAFKHDSKILIEEYINGEEVTIPVIGDFIMNPVKIFSPSGIWDEERKNNLQVEMLAVKPEEKVLMQEVNYVVKSMRDIFELESFWRVDTIFKDGKLYVLELNTQPCLAGGKNGVLPTSERAMGWTHFDFVSKVVEEAYKRKTFKHKRIIKIVG